VSRMGLSQCHREIKSAKVNTWHATWSGNVEVGNFVCFWFCFF
jgi:hypothetical protein